MNWMLFLVGLLIGVIVGYTAMLYQTVRVLQKMEQVCKCAGEGDDIGTGV